MLLQNLDSPGFPVDYLLARVRGRRVGGGSPRLGAEAEPWPRLLAAARWLYVRLPPRRRAALAPLWQLLELRTLILCLRFRAGSDRAAGAALLPASLLAPPICALLQQPGELPQVLTQLAALAQTADLCGDLPALYAAGGLQAVEATLHDRLLLRALAAARPEQEELCRYLLDGRNLLTVVKYLRWELAGPPPLLAGGQVPAAKLLALWRRRDAAGVAQVLRRLSGTTDADPLTALVAGLARRLRRASGDPLAPVTFLDDLARLFLAAREAAGPRRQNGSPS